MNRHANPAVIGSFVIGAAVLLVAGILVFSSGKFFKEKNRFVVYFDESVNGLNIGAPVKLHGVQIGKVTDIRVKLDTSSKKILTTVFLEIEPDATEGISDLRGNLSDEEVLKNLINDGLRLQLQLTSLLTGQLYIEALLRPDTPVRFFGMKDRLKELPTIKSSGEELQNTFNEALNDFRKIPFEELFADLHKTIRNIERLTGAEETMAAIHSLSQTLDRANKTMQTVQNQSGPLFLQMQQLVQQMQQTVKTSESTLEQARSTFATLETTAAPDSLIAQHLEETLKELSKAARSGRVLLDYLERHPEALLHGKKTTDTNYEIDE